MKLDPTTTALIVIDLQRGIVARQAAPHSASEVVERCAKLADAFRERNALVVLVHVAFADDRERLNPEADGAPPLGPLPHDWSEIVPEIGPRPGDIVITKRQWGAFYGTALDLQFGDDDVAGTRANLRNDLAPMVRQQTEVRLDSAVRDRLRRPREPGRPARSVRREPRIVRRPRTPNAAPPAAQRFRAAGR